MATKTVAKGAIICNIPEHMKVCHLGEWKAAGGKNAKIQKLHDLHAEIHAGEFKGNHKHVS
jgi:hypothetical protein